MRSPHQQRKLRDAAIRYLSDLSWGAMKRIAQEEGVNLRALQAEVARLMPRPEDRRARHLTAPPAQFKDLFLVVPKEYC